MKHRSPITNRKLNKDHQKQSGYRKLTSVLRKSDEKNCFFFQDINMGKNVEKKQEKYTPWYKVST